ncbi:hypothetical protein F441_16817, partial [Phytophthora nicotianae CJ01A1]
MAEVTSFTFGKILLERGSCTNSLEPQMHFLDKVFDVTWSRLRLQRLNAVEEADVPSVQVWALRWL